MNNLGNKKTMAKNIRFYMELNDKTRKDICEDLNIKYTTFTEWINGTAYPRIDKIEMLASYFGIKKADLVEDHEVLATFGIVEAAVRQKRLLAYFNRIMKLSNSEQDYIFGLLDTIIKREEENTNVDPANENRN